MKRRRTRSSRGRNTFPQFVIGLLIVLVLFLRAKSSSTVSTTTTTLTGLSSQVPALIKSIFLPAGYSDNMVRWWTAVSDLETGTWTSDLYKKYNNCFGMKMPKTRNTTAITPTPTGFASYNSASDSVKDIILYLKNFNYPLDFENVESLVTYMKKVGYFEEPYDQYLAGVKSRL
jgi:hypothetical protein